MLRTTSMPPQFLTLSCTARSSATRIPSNLTRSRFTYANPLGSVPCGWKELSLFSAVWSEDWAWDSPTCTGGGATFPNAILGRNWSNRRRVSSETNYVESPVPRTPESVVCGTRTYETLDKARSLNGNGAVHRIFEVQDRDTRDVLWVQ